MDIQKEREAFELSFKSTQIYCRECAISGKDILEFSKTMNGYFNIVTNDAWNMWLDAKAQAVPEGFVVVSQKDLLELTIAINAVDLATHTESKTNEVREMWQHVALKLMALGISQEPANDD